jgi:hypothetical protein
MSQYIFGEIDVPGLDDDKSPVAPFDVSRSMQLNPENEIVRALHAFVGNKVEEVRRALLDADKKRKAEEDTKKLAEQASEIARIINEDFEAFRQRVAKIRAKTRGGPNLSQDEQGGDDLGDDLIFGSDVPARETSPTGSPGRNGTPILLCDDDAKRLRAVRRYECGCIPKELFRFESAKNCDLSF